MDDVVVVPAKKGKVVLKVDMLVQRTDVPAGMSYRQAARKSVAMCVSDFAAKGARPDSFMISLGLPRGVSSADVRQLSRGFRDAEREWGVELVGGDTNEAGELVIDCAMVGFGTGIVGRGGAKPGDVLVVGGRFGLPPAGLKLLADAARATDKFRSAAVSSALQPRPNLHAGLALSKFLTSSMDSSDGLARSLHVLARDSGVGFELDSLPVAEGVREFAAGNGVSFESLVLFGGEEYVIVGTVGRDSLSGARKAAARAGTELLAIGKATSSRGVVVLRSRKGKTVIPDKGWTHLG